MKAWGALQEKLLEGGPLGAYRGSAPVAWMQFRRIGPGKDRAL
jgi:hypothetical protein